MHLLVSQPTRGTISSIQSNFSIARAPTSDFQLRFEMLSRHGSNLSTGRSAARKANAIQDILAGFVIDALKSSVREWNRHCMTTLTKKQQSTKPPALELSLSEVVPKCHLAPRAGSPDLVPAQSNRDLSHAFGQGAFAAALQVLHTGEPAKNLKPAKAPEQHEKQREDAACSRPSAHAGQSGAGKRKTKPSKKASAKRTAAEADEMSRHEALALAEKEFAHQADTKVPQNHRYLNSKELCSFVVTVLYIIFIHGIALWDNNVSSMWDSKEVDVAPTISA